MRHLFAPIVLVLLALPAWAQEEAPAEPAAKEAETAPVVGMRYQVTLRQDRTVSGVVRSDSTYERFDRGAWVDAKEDEKGAGVRLWFPGEQAGFVFIPKRDMVKIERLGALSGDEGRFLANARTRSRERAEEERKMLKEKRRREEEAAQVAAEAGAELAAAEAEAAEVRTTEEKLALYTALLAKFPPTDWSLDTPQEIERRWIVLGLPASASEKEFVSVFDDWKAAYAMWQKAQQKAEKPAEATDAADAQGATGE